MLKSLLAEVPYETISVPVKTILLEAGKIAQKVFFVHSGCIRQWYNANGKDITCQFFFENSPIACIESFIKSQPSEYTLVGCIVAGGHAQGEGQDQGEQ